MRVRHLLTYLSDERLLLSCNINDLRGLHLGIDATYWIRALGNLKAPLADALGGVPVALFSVIDQQIALFAEYDIKTTYVFSGMQPRSHMLFSSHSQMDEAWDEWCNKSKDKALLKFAQATSRNNSELIWSVFHYLKSKKIDVLQSCYFANAQLAALVTQGYFQAVYGHPSLLLFGIPRVVVTYDFTKEVFEWVGLTHLLDVWSISKIQFIDACLLAGTEYCLTFPYLNLLQFHSGNFTFATAIEFIKQADLASYMVHFPNEEMKADHVDKYCICKTLIMYSPVLNENGNLGLLNKMKLNDSHSPDRLECPKIPYENSSICPKKAYENNSIIYSGSDNCDESNVDIPDSKATLKIINLDAFPRDFSKIVGVPLTNKLYLLMTHGFISKKIPSVLALGEWIDYSHPTVDSIDYRALLNELVPNRCRALGLVAAKLHPHFHTREITFSRYVCSSDQGERTFVQLWRQAPNVTPGMIWNFESTDVVAEMKRQNVNIISLGFCLNWHAYAEQQPGTTLYTLPSDTTSTSSGGINPKSTEDLNCILTLVNFKLLEALQYFSETGSVTLFGSALQPTPLEFQEDALFALELMAFGAISGDRYEAPPDRLHCPGMKLFKYDHSEIDERHILLLSRVMSLIPMTLNSYSSWKADVDYDLAAFHSIVRILKHTLRQLTEACLVSILLERFESIKLLPIDLMSPINPHLPVFILPRNCMGIIVKAFLEFDPQQYITSLEFRSNSHTTTTGSQLSVDSSPLALFECMVFQQYPCCITPITDLLRGIRFWMEMCNISQKIYDNVDDVPIQEELDQADEFLWSKIRTMGLDKHPSWQPL